MKMKPSLLVAAAFAMTSPAFAAPLVYVPMGMANQIIIIDAAKDQVIGKVAGVPNPHGLAASMDGKMLIAGSLAIIPTAGGLPPKPAGMSEATHKSHHSGSAGMSMNMPGKSKKKGKPSNSNLSVIMAATNSIFRRIVIPGRIHHTLITPDGRYGVAILPTAAGVSIVDLQKFTVIKTVPTGPMPNYAVASPDSAYVYVSNAGNGTVSKIETGSWRVVENIKVGKEPEHMAMSAQGDRLYISNVGSGSVTVVATQTGTVVKTYALGGKLHGIDVAKDGKSLYVSVRSKNKLVAIDLATGSMQALPMAPQPYHLAVIGGTGKLYVSSAKENKIWVVDQKSLKIQGQISVPGIAHQMAVLTEG